MTVSNAVDTLIFIVLCYAAVATAAFVGFSEEAGLFAAITGGGAFIINRSNT